MLQTATPAEIASAIILDTSIRSDGYSHRQRVAFVLDVFGADTIDLGEEFDYGIALSCWNDRVVQAWKELAILQGTYAEGLFIFQWIDEDVYNTVRDHILKMIQHIDWHLHHLIAGRDAPALVILDE